MEVPGGGVESELQLKSTLRFATKGDPHSTEGGHGSNPHPQRLLLDPYPTKPQWELPNCTTLDRIFGAEQGA